MQRALVTLLLLILLGGGGYLAYTLLLDRKKEPKVDVPANPVKMSEDDPFNPNRANNKAKDGD